MKMVKAIIRPEKCQAVLDGLNKAGYRAVTRYSILGRGKQRGLKVGDVYYDEIPKEVIMMVLEEERVDKAVAIIEEQAKNKAEGSYGDGKIFITPVEKAITIRSGKEEL